MVIVRGRLLRLLFYLELCSQLHAGTTIRAGTPGIFPDDSSYAKM